MAILTLRVAPCFLFIIGFLLLGNELDHVVNLFNQLVERVSSLKRDSDPCKLERLGFLSCPGKILLQLLPDGYACLAGANLYKGKSSCTLSSGLHCTHRLKG